MPVIQYDELCAQAISHLNNGKPADAAILFQEVLTKHPTLALAWNNRGLALKALGHPFDAITNIDRAIALDPNGAEYYNNRGTAYYDMKEYQQAFESYEKALKIKPKFAEALMNMGHALKVLGNMEKALQYYKDSVAAKPEYVDAHLALSFAQLATGDFKNGWKELEWRWKSNQLVPRNLPVPDWDGSNLHGKSLLIYSEQGFGDALQFMRYAPLVKKLYSGTVYVEVRQPLTRITKTMAGVDGVITFGEKLPEIDYAIPMVSLPNLVGTTVETIPWSGPYLHSDPYRVSIWKEKLKALPPGIKVGLCWAGMSRPGQPVADGVDQIRSTTLESFSGPASVPGVSWVSLQKGPPSEQVQRPPRGMTIGDWTELFDDFYDTAAMIECLDLVIAVDTSVVHLAGAMGKPVWMISRFDGCWRWMGDRPDSPWYPSLKQYCQPKAGDWQSVMRKVEDDLRKLVILNRMAA